MCCNFICGIWQPWLVSLQEGVWEARAVNEQGKTDRRWYWKVILCCVTEVTGTTFPFPFEGNGKLVRGVDHWSVKIYSFNCLVNCIQHSVIQINCWSSIAFTALGQYEEPSLAFQVLFYYMRKVTLRKALISNRNIWGSQEGFVQSTIDGWITWARKACKALWRRTN